MRLQHPVLYIFILSTLLSCDFTHCLSKKTFLDSYSDFTESVEKERRSGNSEWKATDVEFKDFMDRCYEKYKDELTIDEKKLFWKKTLKYYYNRYNGNFMDAYKDAETRFSEDFKKDLDDVLKNADADMRTLFSDLFKEDLKGKIDEILKSLDKWGDKLKKTLDEMEKETDPQ